MSRLSPRPALAILTTTIALALALTWDLGDPARAPHAKTDRMGLYDLGEARILARVLGHLRTHYVAPERFAPRVMAVAALERVQAEVPEVRVAAAPRAPAPPERLRVSVGATTREFALDRVDDLYQLNWKLMEVFEFLERNLPPSADLERLEYAAVNGLLSTLDPHTVLMTPAMYRELQLSQRGRFGGLGLTLGVVEGAMVIQSVLPGGPAAAAGLAADDVVVEVDGASLVGLDLDEAANLLRGVVDSRVTLRVSRGTTQPPRTYTLVRREIEVPSVDFQALGDGVAWVAIRSFQESTGGDLERALTHLEAQPGGLRGLVLDLRDNPGGLLEQAIAVANTFLDRGTIVTTVRDGGREREESHATHAHTRASLPLVVLVNRGSASASEIVAGALKRNDRALLVGQRTFGKGSVQVIYRIDDAALKLTIAQYLTPHDLSIQGVGVVPDIDLVPIRVPSPPRDAPFDGRLDLHPTAETQGGEASLRAHLSSDKTHSETPSVILRLLDELHTPMHLQRGTSGRVRDAWVTLAQELVTLAKTPDRRQALLTLQSFFPKRQAESDARLEAALAPLQVDWRAGPRPDASTQRRLTLDLHLPEKTKSGSRVTVTIEIHNTSPRPVARLHAELTSRIPALDAREVAWGLVPPGARLTRTLTVTLPPGTATQGDVVQARLFADGEPLPHTPVAEARLAVEGPRAPAFTMSYALNDGRDGNTEFGNGDGLLQPGERPQLEVFVRQAGPGTAQAVVASVRNETGPALKLTRARVPLGAMKSGETRVAVFALEVDATLPSRVVALGLEVSAAETAPQARVVLPIELPVFPTAMPPRRAAEGFALFPDVPTPLVAGASRDAWEVGEAAPHAVLAVTAAAGDWLEVRWRDPLAKGQDRVGWVPEERVTRVREGAARGTDVRTMATIELPILEIESIATFTNSATVSLKGNAQFSPADERTLIYVFRGRDKVFFQDTAPPPSAPNASSSDRRLIAWEATIALDPGPNELTIIARGHDNRVARQALTVYRLPSP